MDHVETKQTLSADSPSCTLAELSAHEIHRNIMRCHALSQRVKRRLLDWLHALIKLNYSSNLGSSQAVLYVMKNLKYEKTEASLIVEVATVLNQIPRSADAFQAREIAWGHVKAIAHMVKEGKDAKEGDWLRFAQNHSVHAIKEEVKNALEEGRSEPRNKRGGLPRTRHTVSFIFPSEKIEVIRKALELAIARKRAKLRKKEEGAQGGAETEEPEKAVEKDGGEGGAEAQPAEGEKKTTNKKKATSKRQSKEEARYEMCLDYLRQQGGDDLLAIPGTRHIPFTVAYTVCSICKESRVLTAHGPEEVPHEHIDEILGEARTVTIGPDELVKGETLPEKVEGEIPDEVVAQVLALFNNSCAHCGRRLGLHIHHIVFKSRGGPHELWNLIPVCPGCHACIHLSTLEVFRDSLGTLHWRSMADRITAVLKDELEELAAIPSIVVVAREGEKPPAPPAPAPATATAAVSPPAPAPECKAPPAAEHVATSAKKATWLPDSPEYRQEAQDATAALVKLSYDKKDARRRVHTAMAMLLALGRAPTGDEIVNSAIRGRPIVLEAGPVSARAEDRREGQSGKDRREGDAAEDDGASHDRPGDTAA